MNERESGNAFASHIMEDGAGGETDRFRFRSTLTSRLLIPENIKNNKIWQTSMEAVSGT